MKIISLLIAFFSFQALANPIIAYEEVKNNKAIIIDVRESQETNEGYIKLAQLIPLSSFEANENETVEKVKKLAVNKSIYVHCRSGKRSEKVKEILQKNSIKSTNLGGFSDLVNIGLPSHQ
jgi:rhodanese-related sulfurtransferase